MTANKLMLLLLIAALPTYSAEYFVSPEGSASWSQCTNIDTPCHLSTANQNAQAGDTVYLKGGIYDEYIRPSNSGTESNRIVFTNYQDENASIQGTRYGIYIEGKSYIEVAGINFYHLDHHLFIRTGEHNVVHHCNFEGWEDTIDWAASNINYNSRYNHVYNCNFSHWGYKADRDWGALFDIGREAVTDDDSFYNLVEDCHFYYAGHHVLATWSKYSVIRNNYFHNEIWGEHQRGYRDVITHGMATGWNLFEGNRFAFADRSSGMALRSENNIFRRNMFYLNGNGAIQIVGHSGGYKLPENCLVYNNAFYHNGWEADYAPFSGAIYFADWNNVGPLEGNEFKNNIFFDNKGGAFSYDSDVPERISIMENNYEGDPDFVFDDSIQYSPFGPKPDFHLEQDSPCIDAGVALTTITSPSGSGRTFEVENPWYFYDGWTIPGEIGDLVQLEGDSVQARVIDVDYETGEISVDTSLTWTQDQGISLAYNGAAPDIGAYEYEIISCDSAENCPDRQCNHKSCISDACSYSPSEDGILCNGECATCSNGRCTDDSALCETSQICSSGECILNPHCVTSEQLLVEISDWLDGDLQIPELLDIIDKWKDCS